MQSAPRLSDGPESVSDHVGFFLKLESLRPHQLTSFPSQAFPWLYSWLPLWLICPGLR